MNAEQGSKHLSTGQIESQQLEFKPFTPSTGDKMKEAITRAGSPLFYAFGLLLFSDSVKRMIEDGIGKDITSVRALAGVGLMAEGLIFTGILPRLVRNNSVRVSENTIFVNQALLPNTTPEPSEEL